MTDSCDDIHLTVPSCRNSRLSSRRCPWGGVVSSPSRRCSSSASAATQSGLGVASTCTVASLNYCTSGMPRSRNWIDPGLLVIDKEIATDFGGSIKLSCIDSQGELVIVELNVTGRPGRSWPQALDYVSWVRRPLQRSSDDAGQPPGLTLQQVEHSIAHYSSRHRGPCDRGAKALSMC